MALPLPGQGDRQTAVVINGLGFGAKHQKITERERRPIIPIDPIAPVLRTGIELGSGIVGEGGGLAGAEMHSHLAGRRPICKGLACKGEGILVVLMLKTAIHGLGIGGSTVHVDKETVLITGVVDPFLDPIIIVPGVGALHAVNVVPASTGQIGIGALAGPGVDHNGIVGAGNAQVVGAQRPDGTQGRLPLQVGENCHHPGDATLCQNFIHDVSMAGTALRHSHLDVINHDRIGTAFVIGSAQGLSSQGIDIAGGLLCLRRYGFRRRRRR